MKRTNGASLILWFLFLGSWLMLAGCGGGGGNPDQDGNGHEPPAPGVFNLIAPAHNDTASTTPTLSWSAASNATSYRVELASGTTFTSSAIIHTATVPSTVTSYTTPALAVGGKYTWTVWAINDIGESASQYYAFTVNNSGGLVWGKTSPGKSYDAEPFAMAIDSYYMYVAGYELDSADEDQWRIEKRSLATGELVSGFSNSGVVNSDSGTATAPVTGTMEDVWAMAVGSGYLYLAGYDSDLTGNERWRIEKRTTGSGALVAAFDGDGIISEYTGTGGSNQALAIAPDSSSLYVAGFDAHGPDGAERWRIEKRDLITGATSTLFTLTSAVTSTSAAQAIVTSETTGTVYAGGYTITGGDSYWHLEARVKTSGVLDSSFASGIGTTQGAITALLIKGADLYVVGFESTAGDSWWRIERRSLSDGALATSGTYTYNPSTGPDVPYAIAMDGTNIYVAGYDSGATDQRWRVEKYDSNLALVPTFGTNGVVRNNPGPYDDVIYGIAVDPSGLYLAGSSQNGTFYEWRMEKRKK